jgi:hypothetical protein
MIVIRRDYPISNKFRELVEFFNKLEKSLEYPNCEGYNDEKRVLQNAEQQLIKLGKL